eukprot:TRINITY_DN3582_c0_g1_i1.p1 TRINITY_DN3582_c0_g1~~TRINITY_DN3582_c0_g1_i1.p1  ORF type:complete len:606 (+),score=76.32 TRINITY_DN3582_c0_g1_i1:673-2490(+)
MRPFFLLISITQISCLSLSIDATLCDFAPPMQIISSGAVAAAAPRQSFVGSDENNCSVKDTSGRRVTPQPTAGYVQFNFSLSSNGYYAFLASIHTPDSMSDSFWVQFDDGPAERWACPDFYVWGIAVVAPDASGLANACRYLAAGAHNVRFFIREPGAGIAFVNVTSAPLLEVQAIFGCGSTGCPREGGTWITVVATGLCGPATLPSLQVTVAGETCQNLTFINTGDLTCLLPGLSYALPETVNLVLQRGNSTATAPLRLVPLPKKKSIAPLAASAAAVGLSVLLVGIGASVFMYSRRRNRVFSIQPETRTPPRGEIALVFTDIQGSSSLWEADEKAMDSALAAHSALLRNAIIEFNGYEIGTEGDAFVVAFDTALEALQWCLAVQLRLLTISWSAALLRHADAAAGTDSVGRLIWNGLRVRMGIHVGEPLLQQDRSTHRMAYVGPAVNRAAKISAMGVGGQVLLSQRAVASIREQLHLAMDCLAFPLVIGRGISTVVLTSHGRHHLQGIASPETLFAALPLELQERAFPTFVGSPVQELRSVKTTVRLRPARSLGSRVGSGSDLFKQGAPRQYRSTTPQPESSVLSPPEISVAPTQCNEIRVTL